MEDNDYSIMRKTEAAVAWVTRVNGATKAQELDAFMSIFHPKFYSNKKKMRELHESMRDKKGNPTTRQKAGR